jgi:catechol 2,3-dioxygenase-like lactoylglutathione lyase family enzyme
MTNPDTDSMPATDGFAHVTLPVHDLEAAERFYVDVLGGRLVRRLDRETFLRARPERAAEADADNSPLHLAIAFPDAPELHLFLQRGARRSAPAPHPHIAMNVDHDELDRCVARLARGGVPYDGPRRLGPPGHASVYFADPSSNLLEFVTLGYAGPTSLGPPDVSRLGWKIAEG